MAGGQERHQLVPQLLGRHGRAVLVASGEEHREDVVGVLIAGGAALLDLGDE